MSIGINIVRTAAGGSSSGISPCQVFFDATATSSSIWTTSSQQFRRLYYLWDFGDTGVSGTSTWTYGCEVAKSRNIAEGAIAGHIYERTDGSGDATYTATLYAYDGVSWASSSVTTMVFDATSTNGWPSRYVVSTDGDFTGAPTGTQQTTASFATVLGYLTAGRRVSLKRGNTWSKTGSAGYNNATGPWQIDDWGSAASSGPIIQANSGGTVLLQGNSATSQIKDIRLVNLSWDNNGQAATRVLNYEGGGPNASSFVYWNQLTILRNTLLSQFDRGWMTMQQTGVFMQDNSTQAFGYNIISGGNINSAILGNYFQENSTTNNVTQEGNIRWGNVNKFVLSNNSVKGAEQGRQHIKCHAQTGTPSDYVVGSGNKCYTGGLNSDVWWVNFAPTDNTHDERVQNVIWERNHIQVDGPDFDRAYEISCTKATFRNNLLSQTTGSSTSVFRCFSVQFTGAEPPETDIEMYNNTVYSPLVNSLQDTPEQGFVMVWVNDTGGQTFSSLIATNNYGSAPNWALKNAVYDPNGFVTATTNTVTNTPGWVTTTPSVFADFKLLTTSAAKDTGTTTYVFADAFAVFRPQNLYDKGMAEFSIGTLFPWQTTSAVGVYFSGNKYLR